VRVSGFSFPDLVSSRPTAVEGFFFEKMTDFKEVELEQFIYDEFKNGGLTSRGISVGQTLLFRQYEISGCGVIDLMTLNFKKSITDRGVFKYLYIDIYELKRGELTCADFGQLCRYIHAVRRNIRRILDGLGLCGDYSVEVMGRLIGDGIQRDAQCLYNELCSHDFEVYTINLSMKHGVTFEMLDRGSVISDVKINSFSKTFFRRLARASYPFAKDHRTVEQEDNEIEITNEMLKP